MSIYERPEILCEGIEVWLKNPRIPGEFSASVDIKIDVGVWDAGEPGAAYRQLEPSGTTSKQGSGLIEENDWRIAG